MADEEKQDTGDGGGEAKGKKKAKGKAKDNKKKKTWEEKHKEAMKKKMRQVVPWGSDPCVQFRLMKEKPTKKDLTAPKGSQFPWYEKPKKFADIAKEAEKRRKKQQKANPERLKESQKKYREMLKKESELVRSRRMFYANRDPDCDETYEEFIERRERKRKLQAKRKGEEEAYKAQEAEEERRAQEEQDEENEGGKKKRRRIGWPGEYPSSVTQDFIMLLKMIMQVEYETGETETKKKVCLPTKKNKIVNEFSSFLNVLFTANEMMKNKSSKNKDETPSSKSIEGGKEESVESKSTVRLEVEEKQPTPELPDDAVEPEDTPE